MWILLFILGVCIGSFLNVLIDRLPKGQDIIYGRSHCDHCKRKLSWYELIPIVSWSIQGGKSSCCHKKLSIQYPLIELITGIGFILLYITLPKSGFLDLTFISSLLILCASLVIFVVDLKTELIPLEMVILGCISACIRISPDLVSCVQGNPEVCSKVSSGYLIPTAIGVIVFFLLWYVSKGKAMGDGDIYIALFIGLVTGFPLIIVAYYVAFLTGAMVSVILILGHKKRMKSHIPFGPFLLFGMGSALLYGQQLITLWRTLL